MGFTDRLLAAPVSRFAIVLGRLAGTAALGAFTAVWFIVIGLAFGARIEEGVAGVLLAILLVTGCATAVGGIAASIALRTGSASVVQGLFPLIFVILFLSSAFFPRNLMLEPAASVAEWNPFSFITEAIRDPVISAFSAEAFAEGVASITLLALAGLVFSSFALRHRLEAG
jgi:ABC-2 type transport system permease protein